MKEKQRKTKKRGKVYIYGRHALVEALQNTPQIIQKVFLAPDIRDAKLRTLIEAHKISISLLNQKEGKQLVGRDTAHQGIIATMDPTSLLIPFSEFIEKLNMGNNPALAILGEVQDPHNVGAIIRSAAAFGFAGVLIPEHNQAPVTGSVVKTSAGMAFCIPLVTIGNVNNTLEILKKKGFWTYALAMEGSTTLGTDAFDRPSAFVIGNEGTGVRPMTLAHCDVKLSIPMHKRSESLNAATSAAIVFYEWSKKHPESLA